MPKAKFEAIFHDLRQRIEEGQYPFQSLLPSENQLTELYSCSRNTIRRATSGLAELGYVRNVRYFKAEKPASSTSPSSRTNLPSAASNPSKNPLPGTTCRPPLWCYASLKS